jgi:hypothetical protein
MMISSIIVKTTTGSTKGGLGKLSELLSRQNEGLSKEERESRLLALEGIASSVRARRSKSSRSLSIPEKPAKPRIHA